jgi:hypothetical protein
MNRKGRMFIKLKITPSFQVLTLVAAALCSCKGNGIPATTNLNISQKNGYLTGSVVDATTRSPIANASVLLSDVAMTTTTGSDGLFAVTAPTGHHHVVITADGYFAWSSDEGIGTSVFQTQVALIPQGPSQLIGSAGGTVNAGASSLAFPADAYAVETPIFAQFITGSGVHSLGVRSSLQIDAGTSLTLYAVLAVHAGAQPQRAVTVSIPVPPGGGHIHFTQVSDDGNARIIDAIIYCQWIRNDNRRTFQLAG